MDPFVSSILNPVFQRVIDAAVKEYKSVRDVKKEIRKLRTMFFMINGFLEDAERKQDEHGAIRAWLKELKQVLFDAEDVFDEIATDEALGRDAEDGTTRLLSKVRFKLFSCLRKADHLSSSRAIAHQVKEINERFDDISKKKEELKLCETDGTCRSVFWRPHTTSQLPPGEAHIIGREVEMENIKDLLLDHFAAGTIATTSGNYKLSYDYLPGHLKQCFAYCSLFPEDHEFDKDKLVQLWMAQQFIQIREGFFHLESMGGEYFDDLVRMSLFEKCKYDQERYVMHDLIHNLADSVSKDDYLRLEDNKQNETISETIRHLSIASDKFDPAQLCNNYENMRTLLFLRGCEFQLDPHLDSIFMKLQRLRVLGLNGCNIKKLPASIGTLKHLRFLDLSNNPISKLPDSLCNLHNLQVLNLKDCDDIRALPRNMSALINLRHLIVDEDRLVGGIQGLGKLTALHELDDFDCARQPIKELADMGMLRRLRITSLEEVKSREEAIQSRLDKKEHLDELTLEWRDVDDDDDDVNHLGLEEDVNHPGLEAEVVLDSLQPPQSSIRRLTIENYGGSRSPSWMEDPSWLRDSCFLRTIELYGCTNWEVLPPLGQLLCLDSLKISRMGRVRRIEPAFMGCCYCHALEGELPQGGFPSLQVLEFEDMEEWEEWEVPLGTDIDDGGEDDQVFSEAPLPRHDHRRPLFLARLRELRIEKCPKLRQLPPLPPTLTKLHLYKVGLTHLPEWWLPPSSSSSSSSSPSLSSLEIYDCPELTSLADGLLRHPLPNLVHLCIIDCQGLVSLPPDTAFGHLTSLKELVVESCPKLAWPSTCESPSVEEEDAGLPPSLERVTIYGVCGEVMDQIMLAIVGSRQKLACLTYLWIVGCFSRPPPPPTLRRSLPSSLQQLTIRNNDQLDDETLSAWLRGLTSLRELDIRSCPAVTSLPRSEVLSHLTALEKLKINRLQALSSFGGGVHCLVSLEELTIGDCPELLDITTTTAADSSRPSSSSALPSPARSSVGTSTTRIRKLVIWRSSMQQIKTWLLQCPSLQVLSIRVCPQLTGFGNGGDDGGDVGGDLLEAALLNLSGTLQRLEFYYCENLRSLPPRLRRLCSLQSLTIEDCPQIRSLPEAGPPESLRELVIRDCPALEERCKEGVGSDWPLISHIPTRRFGL